MERPPRTSRLELLHVGRMAPSKGLDEIIEALAPLKARGFTNWRLRVVHQPLTSDRHFEQRIRAAIDRHSLSHHVEFIGMTNSRHRLARLYMESDITLVASHSESYCLPLQESLWCGTPVIAYSVAAIPEVAGGLANLVPDHDTPAYAHRILDLAHMRPLVACDRLGPVSCNDFHAACRSHLADRTPKAFRQKFLDCLRTEGKWRL